MDQKIEREKCKSSDGEFIYELINYYELSPRMSESILDSAKRCLIISCFIVCKKPVSDFIRFFYLFISKTWHLGTLFKYYF